MKDISYPIGEAVEPFGHFRAYAYQRLDRGRFRHRLDHVGQYVFVAHTHYRLNSGGIAAVDDIAGSQQMGGGDRHGAYLVESDDREPELHAPAQYEHHHVAAPYAERAEPGCRAVGQILQLGKGVGAFVSLVVGPEQGALVGLLGGPRIYHVVGEIEVFRYLYPEIVDEILLGGEAATFGETFYHDALLQWLC